MPGKRKNKESSRTLSDEDKKSLAREVEKYPALWKISDDGYMKRDVNLRCWKAVSEEIAVPGIILLFKK